MKSKDAIVNAFLQRYAEDWAQGVPGALEDYLGLWPEAESLIREQYALLTGTERKEEAARRLGAYRLEHELGRGGQGTVWLAQDERLQRPVALKLLSGLSRLSGRALLRFEREAIFGSRLEHPAICPIYEFGQVDGAAYIAMRYVKGKSLAHWIRAALEGEPEGPLPLAPRRQKDFERLLAFFQTTAEALSHAHDRGVLHRDIKPANLLVTESGEPVILDFGLARWLEGEADLQSETAALSGTPAYIAPELLAGYAEAADSRADLYALGVTLFEALTLKRPFEAATRERLFHAILEDDPQELSRWNPAVGRELRAVVLTAIAREPDRRYRSARALADDLGRLLRGEPVLARRPGPLFCAYRSVRRHPLRWIASFLALGLAAALGSLLASREATELGTRVLERERREAALEYAWLEMAEGHRDLAAEQFRLALEIDPKSTLARAGLILNLLEEEETEAALQLLRSGPIAEGGALQTLADLCQFLQEGQVAKAIESPAFQAASEELFVTGAQLLWHGHRGRTADFAGAVDQLLAAILHPDPDPPYAYFLLADALSHARRPPWNQRLAELLAARWPERPRVQMLIGMLLHRENPAAAMAAFERGFALGPDTRIALRMAHLLSRDPKRMADALRWIEKARKAARGPHERAMAEVLCGQLNEAHGKEEAALMHFQRAHEVSDRSTPATWEVARLLQKREGDDAMLAFWRQALELRPDDPVAHTGLGWRAYASGDYWFAEECVERALRRAPFYGDAWQLDLVLATLRGDADRIRRALTEMEACSERFTTSRTTAAVRGLLALGQFAEAAQRLAADSTLPNQRLQAESLLARTFAASESHASWPEPVRLEYEYRKARERLDATGIRDALKALLAQKNDAPLLTQPTTARLEWLVFVLEGGEESEVASALTSITDGWRQALDSSAGESTPQLSALWREAYRASRIRALRPWLPPAPVGEERATTKALALQWTAFETTLKAIRERCAAQFDDDRGR